MSDFLAQLLQTAVGLHRNGQVDEARQIYQQIIAQDPRHAAALNLLGFAGWQSGQFAEAVEYLKRAIAIDDSQAAYYGNLAEAHRGLGQVTEAIECYAKAAGLAPRAAIVLLNMGTLLEQAGRLEQAATAYQRAIDLVPDDPRAHYHLSSTLEKQGRLSEAAAGYERVLAAETGHLGALASLAGIRQREGDLAAAVRLYQRAAEIEPTRALWHFELGNALQLLRRYAEAVASYRRAVEIDRGYADAYCNLANALRENAQLAEALTCAERAVELNPDSAAAQNNLGVVLQDLGRLAEAQSKFERAIELDPLRAELALNLGTVLRDQGHAARALDQFERALQLQSTHAQALASHGMALLSLGRFKPGWEGYEHRIGLPQFDTATFPQPRWDGEPLAGRTLLVHCEQGLGDTLQFIRYVKPLRQRAGDGRVIVAVQAALVPLLAQSGFTDLVPNDRPLPRFDVHVPLMSLARQFGTQLDNVPNEIPYLAAGEAHVERWRRVLEKYPPLRVGIAWQGRPSFRGDLLRSVPLQAFAPLAAVPEARLVSLQRGPGADQLASGDFETAGTVPILRRVPSAGWSRSKMGLSPSPSMSPSPGSFESSPILASQFEVVDLGDALDREASFVDTAAVMRNLDLVVTSDTAVAHLAGALGVRVWVALAIGPDWRWLLNREDSPWYPTMRLFRQTRVGDWSGVFERMAEELRTFEHAG